MSSAAELLQPTTQSGMALMRIVFSDCDLKCFLLSDQHDQRLTARNTCIDEVTFQQHILLYRKRNHNHREL
jgi:hypothetical protein